MKKLMVVVAHPDDETFGMGGTLALYGSQGVEIHLVCATKGEVGEAPEELMKEFSSVAALREKEFRCAAKILNVTGIHFLGYRDSGMAGSGDNSHKHALINAPIESVAREIALLIREIQPEVIVTFDPIGGYMHPDHIAVHDAAVSAFDMAGDEGIKINGMKAFQPAKLYFHIFPRGMYRLIIKILPLFGIDPEKFGKNKDINLKAIMNQDFPTHAKINYRPYSKQRVQASACYVSQGGDKQTGYIVNWIMRMISPTESYMRAYPEVVDDRIERDLFEGI